VHKDDGGAVCESNTPEKFFTPHDGFEGRVAHQDESGSELQAYPLWK